MTLSEPVIGRDFFGRDETLELLKKRVNALTEGYRQNVALTGQNLAGKSSILHHFLYNFHDNRILPIYVEITDEPFLFFAQRFTGSLIYNFLKSKGLEPGEEYEALIEEARQFIPSTVKSVRDIHDMIRKRDLDSAYSLLFDLTSVVKSETGKSCVIILDEFHNLSSLNVKHPFRNFGKKIMIQKDTMYIVTSSRVATVKRILNEKLSLLFGNFEVIQVNGFTIKNSSDFLDGRFRYMRIPPEIKNFIISLTEGNPFYLDATSQALKDVVASMTFKRVDQEALIDALEKTLFNSKGCIFQYLSSSLQVLKQRKPSDTYISILLAVANGSYKLKEIAKSVKKRTGDVSKYMDDLSEMNILYKNGTFYKFVDKMFGFWLKFVYQRKRSAIISYLPDRIRIFRAEMKDLIGAFVREETKDILSRVAGIFGLFNSEAITLSEKEEKLPLFSSIDIKHFENGDPYIIAKTGKKAWIASVSHNELKDLDIIDFAERCKIPRLALQKKILIALSGIEMNAHLLAKEGKISIWTIDTLNQLMAHYGKELIVDFKYRRDAKR
ncbi:MAG: AAA family ATPase [Candidatus Omnitrophota bacterium]